MTLLCLSHRGDEGNEAPAMEMMMMMMNERLLQKGRWCNSSTNNVFT